MVSAGVSKGDTVAVVGDGAVGLSAVLAAHRLGAERVIALSRQPPRQELAREFGATDIVEARSDEANDAVLALTGGVGVDAALDCVGTAQSIDTGFSIARPGSTVGIAWSSAQSGIWHIWDIVVATASIPSLSSV